MKKTCFQLIFLFLLTSNLLAQKLMNSDSREEFLMDMVESFENEFLWEEKGKEIAKKLRLKIESDDYSGFMDAKLFAATFTRDLFVLSKDRHLTVELKPTEQGPKIQSPTTEKGATFKKEEIDEGIYYIKFDVFPSLSKDLEAEIDRLMSSLTDPMAIVIDLRDNYGGSDQTVNFLAGYFFEERTKLATSYKWGQEAQEIWAIPKEASKAISDARVIILTSQATFSAAEIFTQRLQLHERAVVIGEQTPGAAHRSATYVMSDIFLLNWPYERSEHAVNQQDLEGKGITPDIFAQYNHAKKTAIGYSKNKSKDEINEFEYPDKPLFLNSFLEQMNSNVIEEAFHTYLTQQNKDKVLETFQIFKTVWNEDLNATLDNTHYLENGDIRLVVKTTFGIIFIKLLIEEGKIDKLLYRL